MGLGGQAMGRAGGHPGSDGMGRRSKQLDRGPETSHIRRQKNERWRSRRSQAG